MSRKGFRLDDDDDDHIYMAIYGCIALSLYIYGHIHPKICILGVRTCIWVSGLVFGASGLVFGCLDLYLACLDLYFWCLDLFFLFLDLFFCLYTCRM